MGIPRIFEAVLRHAQDGVVVSELVDREGLQYRIIYANPAMAELTGYTVAELIGQSPEIFHGPTTDQDAVQTAGDALGRGQPTTLETPIRRKDGTAICVEVRLTPVDDPARDAPLLLGIHHEISGRRKEDARFRALVRYAGDVISILDAQGNVLYVS